MNSLPLTQSYAPLKPGRVICVFCGSSPGKSSLHMEAARTLARTFHKHGIKLVYGGGTFGLMGELASTLTSLSGPDAVHGIIPAPLVKYEHKKSGLSNTEIPLIPDKNKYGKTTVVKNMHARKQMMLAEVLSGAQGSGFIALPGGYGTLEELMEIVTWNQLGIHEKGVVVFNVDGYWNSLLNWVKEAVQAGFISTGTSGIIEESKTAENCIRLLESYQHAEGRLQLNWGEE